MNKQLVALIEQRNQIDSLISNFEDGYKYILFVLSYGYTRCYVLKNESLVQGKAFEYNGDEGIVTIFTDNQEMIDDGFGADCTISHIDELLGGNDEAFDDFRKNYRYCYGKRGLPYPFMKAE